MDPGDSEPDREQLESRVDQLEQTVSKMLPDRRGVLKGLGAAAVGGAAVGASSGGASGQSAAGQVGTASEPVDVEAANVAAQSVSTDDDLNNKKTITSDTTDLGASVNAAINDLSPTGGIIELPQGQIPNTTQWDLTAGVNNQDRFTPIIIEGHGQTGEPNLSGPAEGTTVDCSGMGDHLIYSQDSRNRITLRDFNMSGMPSGNDYIHPGANTGNINRWTIRNVSALDGGRWGLNAVGPMIGCTIDDLYINGTERGAYLTQINASNVDLLTVRNTTIDGYTCVIDGIRETECQLYIESNEGSPLEIIDGQSAEVDVYLEANNGVTTRDHAINLSGFGRGLQFSAYFANTNTYAAEEITVDAQALMTFENVTGAYRPSIIDTGTGRNVYRSCFLADVDTSLASSGSTFIQNNINGTINRNAGDTVVSGD